MTQILGYEAGRALRLMILADCRDKNISIGEATAAYQMSAMFTDFDWTGYIDVPGEGRMSIEDYKKQNPWRKFVVIHGPESRKNKTQKIIQLWKN